MRNVSGLGLGWLWKSELSQSPPRPSPVALNQGISEFPSTFIFMEAIRITQGEILKKITILLRQIQQSD